MKNPKAKTHDVDYYCTSAANLAIVYLLLHKSEIARQHAMDAVKTAEAYIQNTDDNNNQQNITTSASNATTISTAGNSATKKGAGSRKSKAASLTADSMKKAVDKAAAADVPHRTVSYLFGHVM